MSAEAGPFPQPDMSYESVDRMAVDSEARLERLTGAHADELFALTDENRAYLRRWLPWVDATRTVEDTRRFIEAALAQDSARNGFQCGVFLRDRLAGVIGLHRIDAKNLSTEIGYWLGEEFTGRGTMTRACRVLVEFLFARSGIHRIQVSCATENLGSQGVPERLGFVREGVLRDAEWLYDHFVDHVVYGLLRRDWQASREDRRREGA